MRQRDDRKIRVTQHDNDVTVFDAGGVDGTPQTVFDLEPPTDIEYTVRNGHKLIIFLRDSDGDPIEDSAELFFIGQDQTEGETDTRKMGRSYRYGEFEQANQRDEDEVVKLDLEKEYEFSEASHMKLQLDSETAVDWSESDIELEVIRKVQ